MVYLITKFQMGDSREFKEKSSNYTLIVVYGAANMNNIVTQPLTECSGILAHKGWFEQG